VDGNYVYLIQPESLSADGIIKSGLWTVRITLGNDVKDHWLKATGDIEKKILACVCGDKSKVQLWLDLQAANMQFCCYKTEEFQKSINELYRQTKGCCGCGDH
jgi:hypothetical protein